MLPHDVYFVDLNIIYSIFYKNIWYLVKLLIVSYGIFYWLPSKIFPQENIKGGVEKIVFNFVYMTAFVEIVVAFLVYIKVFSLLFFILVLLATKLAFLKFYYKKNIYNLLNNLRVNIMTKTLDLLDKPLETKKDILEYIHHKFINLQNSITLYSLSKNILFYVVFIYIFAVLMSRGLLSYSDPTPDTAQFIEWVSYLQQNILYGNSESFGADFYGISVLIFFVNVFTNIDQIILFSLYPILLLFALYFSIYYVIKEITGSKYIGLFAVMIHGMILMSPISDLFLGKSVVTSSPDIINLYGLKFYMPTASEFINGHFNGYIPYIRYISGMAYEHSSVFVLLNAYFLIKTFETKFTRYLIIYTLTLMLVFILHGGGAIVLVFISVLLAINALIFRKLDLKLLKKGSLAILFAAIFGNLWILSMIKYGIPQDFGGAAPILDKLLGTKQNTKSIVQTGFTAVSIMAITKIQIILFFSLVFGLFISFFTKRKFINTSILLVALAINIIYFGPNAGLPLLARQDRLAEYIFFAITILFSFYLFYFIYKPLIFIFKKYAKVILLIMLYFVFSGLALGFPRWMDTKSFWKNINNTQYTSIPYMIMKIHKENRPFSWTVVSFVQSYAKVLNKGYHLNIQNFILNYNPKDKYLKVPTEKIFIFIENSPNPYMGLHEWYYRWRWLVQENSKSWITIYSMYHDNIKVYAKTGTVTVYEIDNNNYIKYLAKKEKK